MATVSCTQCVCALLLTVILTWLPGEAVYFESAYPTSRKQDRHRNSGSSERQRRGRDRSRDTDDDTPATGRSERRRDPFQRTIVLCYSDDDCGRKHFCHGGEGHKSCVPCRKSRKRCHRNDMCCHGYACQDGRCRLRDSRDDEMSYSEAEESFWNEEVPRKKHHGEVCENSDDCMEGLCCTRHLWAKVCMNMLDEGDLCTKKRDRVSDMFQRCDCKPNLSCKRVPDINTRLHACFQVKSNQASEVIVIDAQETSRRQRPDDDENEVPLHQQGSSKSKRQSSHPSAEPNERNEQRAVFSIDPSPHRTVLKRSSFKRDKDTIVVS